MSHSLILEALTAQYLAYQHLYDSWIELSDAILEEKPQHELVALILKQGTEIEANADRLADLRVLLYAEQDLEG